MTNAPIITGADVPALGDSHVRVSERVKREFGDILLTTGAWGTMRIEFDGTYELQRKKYPFYIVESYISHPVSWVQKGFSRSVLQPTLNWS